MAAVAMAMDTSMRHRKRSQGASYGCVPDDTLARMTRFTPPPWPLRHLHDRAICMTYAICMIVPSA